MLFHLLYSNCSIYHFTGISPITWKVHFVWPIPKSAYDLLRISNYRPISLLSLIPKVFESIVDNKVKPILNNLIVDDQHVFWRNKNTTINLLNFHLFISDAIFYESNVDVIYTNFAKAFNKINHHIVFIKLKQIGICKYFFILDYFFYCRSSVNSSIQKVLVYSNTYYFGSFLRISFNTNFIFYFHKLYFSKTTPN